MEKDEFLAVIKHFHIKQWTAAQIKSDAVYGNSAATLKTIYFWINEFKRRTATKEARLRSLHQK